MNDARTGRGRQGPRNRGADIAAILIIAIVLVLLISSAWRYIAYVRLDFVTAASGSVTMETPAEMILVRKEHPLYAQGPGVFVATAEEGSRVGAGAAIGYTQSEQSGSLALAQKDVATANSGVVSFQLDGWEQVLTPDNVYSTDWEQTLALMREQAAATAAASETAGEIPNLASGRPVAKIMDNLTPVMAFICCEAAPEQLEPGDRIALAVAVGGQDKTVTATVATLGRLSGGDWICLVNLGENEELLSAARYQQIKVAGDTVSGASIPVTALFVNGEGKTGVYRRNRNRLEFAGVEVLIRTADQAIVNGLNNTDLVVANPGIAKAGQKLY